MTIGLFDKYGSRSTVPSTEYPDGSFKNESVEGANDGTPLDKDWANDKEGFFQRARWLAGFEVNGEVDNSLESQNFDMFEALFMAGTRPRNASQADVCSGLIGSFFFGNWDPNSSPNYYDLSGTVIDSCVGIDDDTGRPILFLLKSGSPGQLHRVRGCWDYSDDPSGAELPLGLSPSPDRLLSICCDASYLYLMYGANDDKVYIAKINIRPYSSTPVDTVIIHSSYESSSTIVNNLYKVIVANDNKIGYVTPIDDVPVSRFGVISKTFTGLLFDNDGTYSLDGKTGRVVSDGTYLWVPAYSAPVSDVLWKLLKVPISDPSSYTVENLYSVGASDWHLAPSGILDVGLSVAICGQFDTLSIRSKTPAGYKTLFKIGNFNGYTTSPYQNFGATLGFDGLNVWMAALDTTDYGGTPVPYIAVYKFPATAFHYRAEQTTLPEVVRLPLVVDNNSIEADYPIGKFLFDGRDMWLVLRSGDVYRIVNPALR